VNLWLAIRRPIGYLLLTALIWAGLYTLHAIPNLLVNALLGI
jgi:hypothetical protein